MSKAPALIESLHENNGKRSVSKGIFPPGAKCLRHYHADWEETFEIIEGEFTVYIGKDVFTLTAGQTSLKIKTKEIHYFQNLSTRNVTANVISEPGYLGCENATRILSGLESDGKFDLLNKYRGYNFLWIILYDMTNTLLTGLPKRIFNFLRLALGNDNIEKERQHLLDKYCTVTLP